MRAAADGWHELVTAAARRRALPVRAAATASAWPTPPRAAKPRTPTARRWWSTRRAYRWRHDGWRGRPWHEAVLYELHVGTFTPAGTFAAAIERLPYLAELGVTAIELMPIADFPGSRNWGYDGVLPFAPDRAYGTPDELKALIDAAHGHGLMVFLDVVYNHFGPEGNYLAALRAAASSPRISTRPGGLRSTSASAPCATSTSTTPSTGWRSTASTGCASTPSTRSSTRARPTSSIELARTVRSRRGRARSIWCWRTSTTAPRFLRHDPRLGRRLYDAQWNDDLHHAAARAADRRGARATTPTSPTTPAGSAAPRACAEGFVYQGEPSRPPGRQAARRALGRPAAAGLRRLPPEPRPDRQPGARRAPDPAGRRRRRSQACQAVLLLCPHVPLLFMGEEWGAPTPFLYFCDFHGELAQAVRDGRRREFAAFFAAAEDGSRSPGRGHVRAPRASTGASSTDPTTPPGSPARACCCGCARARSRRASARARSRSVARELTRRRTGSRSAGGWPTAAGSTLLANLGAGARPVRRAARGRRVAPRDPRRRLGGELPPWSVAWLLRRGRPEPMPIPAPRATYRLQLRGGMDFARAAELVPYLRAARRQPPLPFAAVRGSARLDPRLRRGRPQPPRPRARRRGRVHARCAGALDAHGLGLILDIVPNHMGIGRGQSPGGGTCCGTGGPAGTPASSTSTSPPIPTASWCCRCWARRWTRCWSAASCSWSRRGRRAAPGLFRRAVPAGADGTSARDRPAPAARGAALPPGLLARGRGAAQLPPLLQHRPARRACGSRSRRCSRPATG